MMRRTSNPSRRVFVGAPEQLLCRSSLECLPWHHCLERSTRVCNYPGVSTRVAILVSASRFTLCRGALQNSIHMGVRPSPSARPTGARGSPGSAYPSSPKRSAWPLSLRSSDSRSSVEVRASRAWPLGGEDDGGQPTPSDDPRRHPLPTNSNAMDTAEDESTPHIGVARVQPNGVRESPPRPGASPADVPWRRG